MPTLAAGGASVATCLRSQSQTVDYIPFKNKLPKCFWILFWGLLSKVDLLMKSMDKVMPEMKSATPTLVNNVLQQYISCIVVQLITVATKDGSNSCSHDSPQGAGVGN